jgi:Flp pilus assembly protein TadD
MALRASAILMLALASLTAGCVTPSFGLRKTGPTDEKTIVHTPEAYTKLGDMMMGSAADTKHFSDQQREEMRQDARLSYRKALEVSPGYVPAYTSMARLEMQVRNFGAAEAAYRKALEFDPKNAQLWCELGQVHLKRKEWNKAIEALTKAVVVDPSNKQIASMLGYTLVLVGQTKEALKVLARSEGEAGACVKVARAMYRLNKPKEGLELLVWAEKFDPNLPALKKAKADLLNPPQVKQARYEAPTQPAPKVVEAPVAPAERDEINVPPLPVIPPRGK